MLHLTPEKSKSVCELYFFDEPLLDKTLDKLHWRVTPKGITDNLDKPQKCGICGETLTKDNLACFFAGSVKATCMKEECYLAALHKSKQAQAKANK